LPAGAIRGGRPGRWLITREYTARRRSSRHTMNPHIAAAFTLALCLVLIVVTYILGIEVGKASTLLAHPGYGSAVRA